MNKVVRSILAACAAICSLELPAAWYDTPVVLNEVVVGPSAQTDPHFMSRSADGKTILVNLQSFGDRAGAVLVDLAELGMPGHAGATVKTIANRPSEAYGSDWKGGAVSSDLGLVLFGSGKSSQTCAAATEGDVWLKGAGLHPLATSNGVVVDALAFGTGSRYVYSNVYTGNASGKIARWTYDATANKLVFVNDFDTYLTRVRNISVYAVNGRELVYCGEGEGSAAKVVAVDVTGDDAASWTVKTVTESITGLSGTLTNVKLSGAATASPVLYALDDAGNLAVCTLAADGLSVASVAKTFTAADLAVGMGAISNHYRNFEVSADGQVAYFLKAKDGQVVLSAVGVEPFLESNGKQALDLGYLLKPNTRLEVDYQLTARPNNVTLFSNGSDKGMAIEYVLNNSSNFEPCENDSWKGNVNVGSASDLNRHTVTFDIKNKSIVNSGAESKKKAITRVGTATQPLTFFARRKGDGTYERYSSYRLYAVRIYEDDALVRCYVPGVRDGVKGLVETRSGAFFSATYGELAALGAGAMPMTEDGAYVESTSDLTVDTGYTVGPETAVACDFMMTSVTKSTCLMEAGVDNKDGQLLMRMYVNGSGNHAWTFKDKTGSNAWISTGIQAQSGVRRVQRNDSFADRITLATGAVTNYGVKVSSAVPAESRTCRSGTTLRLFGGSDENWGFVRMRVYGLKIYEKGVLVRDFQPMRRKGTTVGVLRDRVTGAVVESFKKNCLVAGPEAAELDEHYVESQGCQVVNTGYFVSKATRLEVDFQYLENNKNYDTIFGAYEGSDNTFHAGLLVNQNENLEWPLTGVKANSYWSGGSMGNPGTTRHTAVMDLPNKQLLLYTPGADAKSITIAGTIPEATAPFPLALFGDNTTADFTAFKNYSKSRIYQMRIYENGDLVKCFIPAVEGGVSGVRESVGGTFCPAIPGSSNADSTSLVPSLGLLEGDATDAPDLYLESDGTQAIDTGYVPTATTRLELDFQLKKIKKDSYLLGAFNDNYHWSLYLNYLCNFTAVAHQNWEATQTIKSDYARTVIALNRPTGKIFVTRGGKTSEHKMAKVATAGTGGVSLGLFARQTGYFGKTPMRVYAFRIYEDVTLIHDYLPYKSGDVIGLKDRITGKILTNGAKDANPFVVSGARVSGNEVFETALPEGGLEVSPNRSRTLTVSAVGAVAYRWTMNGKVVAGATGPSLEVPWTKGRHVDTYTVTALYEANGELVSGEPQEVEVTSRPRGLLIVIR